MAQHQNQCSIFANQQLKVSNIFLCSCCFWSTATWLSFRCWPALINLFTDCFHWAKLPTLSLKFCNNWAVSETKFPQCLALSFIIVQYFTHNQTEIWCKNNRAFLRYSDVHIGIFYFDSPCTSQWLSVAR